jgi:superfamily II DNA or RNA helicase
LLTCPQRQLDINQLLDAIRENPAILESLLELNSKDKRITDLEKNLAQQKQKNHDLSVALNQNKEENLQHQQHGRDILYRLLSQHQLDEAAARPVQRQASDSALRLFQSGRKRVIIILPTGAGKVGAQG